METTTEPNALTMPEFLDQLVQEETAAATYLTKTESNECTYSKGYITQTVYGCTTCNKTAGMCLGCYVNCHLDHETFEVGLKRNFRCDCGTGAFGEEPCCLMPEKTEENNKNKYDHNFEGKWCICNATYDPNFFMIRCIHCLDFYHLHHLNLSDELQDAIEGNENFTSMICGKCSVKHYKFLMCYNDQTMIFRPEEIINLANEDAKKEEEKFNPPGKMLLGKRTRSLEEICEVRETVESKFKNYNEEKPLFLKDGWQNYLCFCEECQNLYKEAEVYDILTAPEEEPEVEEDEKLNSQDAHSTAESNVTYESTGENSVYDKALKEMTKLDYTTQNVIASIYRDFYEDFKNFFGKFKEEHKVVSQENIQEFFAHLKEKKKDIVFD